MSETTRYAVIPVVLAGGSGTRFWPMSRRDEPKQLLDLFDDGRTMIGATVDRLQPLADEANTAVRVVCPPRLVDPVGEALDDTTNVEFIEEPTPRDTAPAIALATARIEADCGDEPIGFFPADHYILGHEAFVKTMRFAADQATRDAIVTLGIPPTRPETGYGYIECNTPVGDVGSTLESYTVSQFVEKPDRTRALKYLESGHYLWNSGMFVFRPAVLWSELMRQSPGVWRQVERIRHQLGDAAPDEEAIVDAFSGMEAISIDYAVMEDAQDIQVVPAPFRWSDVGHWGALDDVFNADDDGNVVDADAVLNDVSDSIVVSRGSDRLVAASDLDGMVVVDTDDALLVVPKDKAQRVKDLVGKLQNEGRDDLL